MVDLVEISGGNAEQTTSKLHSEFNCALGLPYHADFSVDSFRTKTLDKAPNISKSTRIREAYFTEFAEKVQALNSKVPIQLSGGLWPESFSTIGQ